ncbi:helix-turn-helix domain-containing protein [Herbiconiux sp.]|uniref:TetR/AcrR family transcriptional regulator n=1 Tax=Herbiconiux sp. TaxID=1871186 RepID=UPI0025BF3FB0|nr:helix-turn-helix domain-containing protein [Herbiconiux sp.]
MPRWSPDAALRLEAAALDSFEEHGFTDTTVPQIAARAGLTTRTFFRHFADKRDSLFLRDREFPQAVRDFLRSVPAESTPVATVQLGLASACRGVQGWRPQIARRQAIIRSEPALQERDLLRSHRLGLAIEQSLVERDVAQPQAHTLAAIAVTCFDLAIARWLDEPPDTDLEENLLAVWDDVRAVMEEGAGDGRGR